MSHLRLRVKLNKGKRGISLEKLEKIVAETRKFLVSIAEDLDIGDPSSWVGVDFRNGSLSFTNESHTTVNEVQAERFNESIIALARSEFPPMTREATAEQFFKVAASLDADERAKIGIFPVSSKPAKWLTISRGTAVLARPEQQLPYRQTIGSIQGTIHSLFKESRESFFYIRELSSEYLIKCFYGADDYPAIVRALQVRGQVLHVHGLVVTNTSTRSVKHVQVDRIVLADPFGFEDVERFINEGTTQ